MNDNPVEAAIDEDRKSPNSLVNTSMAAPAIPAGIESDPARPGKHMWSATAFASPKRSATSSAGSYRHGRVVTVGQLILFSTETGDAWLLDPSNQLAARLARDGDPQPVHIEENDTSFVIDWKGDYRIEGPAFIYSDRQTRRVSTILDTPRTCSRHRPKISNMFG